MNAFISPFQLTTEQATALNQLVPYSADSALKVATQLRKSGFDADATAQLMTFAKLRTNARTKFGAQADSMLFTEAGYEQSTRLAVAKLHAQRFVDAGLASVADLGCGIGADSLAFASAGLDVVAVERDEFTASLTAYNLANFEGSGVLCTDLTELDLGHLVTRAGDKVQALWLDPARREVAGGTTSKRVWDAEAFSPPLSFVLKLAATGIPMGVKMGPGIPHDEIPENCEAQWISHAGSVVEVVLWFNALARDGVRRSATVLENNPLEPVLAGEITSGLSSVESPEPVVAERGKFVAEPDGAVIRAHLVSDLAEATGAWFLDEHIAYLSADQPIDSPLVANFEVLDELPLNEKVLKRWVREEGITALTIKKRGVDIVPEQLRATLLGKSKKKAKNGKTATLIALRIGDGAESKRLALWAEPAPSNMTK